MNERRQPSISELMNDHAMIERLLQRAGREAALKAAAAGHSVPISENGKVVWLSPEEVIALYSAKRVA
jgi:hypothetical protein